MGLVSRVSPVRTAVRNCTGDEGGGWVIAAELGQLVRREVPLVQRKNIS